MLVIRKKQIILATLCACLSIFTFMFTTAKEPVKETVSLPVSGKTVILDAGHGVPDAWNHLLKSMSRI